jgi:hypothetical protein
MVPSFAHFYAWVTQIGDESGTSLGVELGVKDMVTLGMTFLHMKLI